MNGFGFYEKYVTLMGNLRDKPDRATPYKIDYLRETIKNGKVYKFISFDYFHTMLYIFQNSHLP